PLFGRKRGVSYDWRRQSNSDDRGARHPGGGEAGVYTLDLLIDRSDTMRVPPCMGPGGDMRIVSSLCFAAALAAPSVSSAFCGFFVAGSDQKLTNNASQVVLLRKGNRTVLTMSNNYQGPPENFAMVVPVPVVLHKEDVKTLPSNVFEHIDALSAP